MTKTSAFAIGILSWLSVYAFAAPGENLDFGRFGTINVYRPDTAAGEPHDVVLILSGDAGWGASEEQLARRLVTAGSLIVGVDTGRYIAQLERATESCLSPSADLENLSHFVQANAQLKQYIEPMLIGYLGGGALAYSALAEAPAGLFRGAISLGFCPDVDLKKPLCSVGGATTPMRKDASGAALGTTVLPVKTLAGKWVALQADSGQVCAAPARKFVGKVGGAELVELTKAGHDYLPTAEWLPQFDSAFRRVAAVRRDTKVRDGRGTALPAALADLPLVVMPAAHAVVNPWFAVFLSGDGGWVGLDKGVSKELASRDIPVVGWDSLKYFWSKRTPEGTSHDLDRVLRYYAAAWGKSRVVLIGYSQGADTMPFMINRLPGDTRALVGFTTLMGISDNAIFEFHVTNWVGNTGVGIPTAPEMANWTAGPYLCLYGESDADAACAEETGKDGEAIKLAGGHHFGGSYTHIAELIVSRLPGFTAGKSVH